MQVFLIIFAFLTIVGGWAGWRRSPLYSHRITLQLLGIFVLIVGAMIGLSLAVTSGSIARSPVVQGILLGIAIIGIATGATGLIIHTTDSHVAQLPPTVRVLTAERHKVQRWIWRTVAYLTISGAIMVAFPSWSWLPGVPALLVLLGGGPMLIGFYMRAKRLDLGMSEVLAEPWAHWQYSPAQWQTWANQQLAWDLAKLKPLEWKRDRGKLFKLVATMAGIFAGCSLLYGGNRAEFIGSMVIGPGLILAIALVANPLNRSAAHRGYRRLLAAPPEVYFGNEGLFCNGEFTPWTLSGAYLLRATKQPDALLVFTFQTYGGNSSLEVEKRVPIPEGRECDVALVQQKLHVICPKAAVRLA